MNGVDGDAASVLKHFAEKLSAADVFGPISVESINLCSRITKECLMMLKKQRMRLPLNAEAIHQRRKELPEIQQAIRMIHLNGIALP